MPDISNVVQDVRCGEGVWAKHPLCRSCLQTGKGGEESATDLCRFRGFRARGPDGIHFVKIGNRASPPKLIFNACMPKQSLEHVQVIEVFWGSLLNRSHALKIGLYSGLLLKPFYQSSRLRKDTSPAPISTSSHMISPLGLYVVSKVQHCAAV